jgi:hypothetical protein
MFLIPTFISSTKPGLVILLMLQAMLIVLIVSFPLKEASPETIGNLAQADIDITTIAAKNSLVIFI